MLAPALRSGLDEQDALAHLEAFAAQLADAGLGRPARCPELVTYQMLDFEHYLSAGLLTKIDRCAMAHGLESRAPFLRRDLIEFALTLPARTKLRGGCGKWALKQAARGLLPEAVLTRRKQGFSPPFSAWARGPLRATVADRLSAERIERGGVLDSAAVQGVLTDHLNGRTEHGRMLWTLLSLQMWAESWVMGRAVAGRIRTETASERADKLDPILQS
jgi:asparagine synthase (glutamine-hydrolysing)